MKYKEIFAVLLLLAAQPSHQGRITASASVRLISQGPGASTVPVVTTEQQDRETGPEVARGTAGADPARHYQLFQLSAELKDSVDKMDTGVLSIDMVKKAEAVETLAKNVKKMKEKY